MAMGPVPPEPSWWELGHLFLNDSSPLVVPLTTGPFHAGRAWRVCSGKSGDSILIKERADSDRAREHARLAWQLASNPEWARHPWLPTMIRTGSPFFTVQDRIYQAWSWMEGEPVREDALDLGLGLRQLGLLSEISVRAFGTREGPLPCVVTREQAIGGWLGAPMDFSEGLEQRVSRFLKEWAPRALAQVRRLPRRGELQVCHGDPWSGNWLRLTGPIGRTAYGLIDWSTARWDHTASDRARLIGSTGQVVRTGAADGDIPQTLAWTGLLAGLCNWMEKRKQGLWTDAGRGRVLWILRRLGEA